MSPKENLHYALGGIAYAVAIADGEVQKEERLKFHNIVEAELRCHDTYFSISNIIFQLFDRDKMDSEYAYDVALKEIKTNSHYLSPELKNTFIKVIEKVAKAYPPITKEENYWIERFKKDIEPLHGDPIYYVSKK